MLYIVLTTPVCNYSCRYCGGSLHGMPDEISYSMSDLERLISKDEEAVVAFYGGEPLLRPEVVRKGVNILSAKRFVINTNGSYIEELDGIAHRFDSILLSIDGREKITDYYRGTGCYATVMKAVDYLKKQDFHGELIARMSVSHKSDIYKEVMHLLDIFPFVHWQLDMIWSPLWDLSDFTVWADENYLPGLKRLVDHWVDHLKQGTILGIVPFLGIVSRMLHGGSGLFCQSGCNSITITTDGSILACPIAPEYSWNVIGDIRKGYHQVLIDEPCVNCEDYVLCGGRCLFAHKERLWGELGFSEMCRVTRFLIRELEAHRSVFQKYKDKLRYPLFNNSTEIIP